jgi:hypothetical protein
MNVPESNESSDEVRLGELFRPVVLERRKILIGTIIATLLAALFGVTYFLIQPSTRSASLEFRPVFEGADAGRYPNGLPFAATDAISASIVEQVYLKNDLKSYCAPDVFRSGLSVHESSPGLEFLNLEYQARLAETRLTAIERQRLEEEYRGRRGSIQPQFRLTFIEPGDCRRIPSDVAAKALTDILQTWAAESHDRRGVMKVRVSVLSPSVFDQAGAVGDNPLVRADLIRNTIARVIENIAEVQRLPGSELVRGGEKDKTFSLQEVRVELEDLMHARLNPLVAQAGRALGRRSAQWIEYALQNATIRLAAAEERAETFRAALRAYSNVPATPIASAGLPDRQQGTDVQVPTPQIDRTFIDRIVELSAANTMFRQEITREGITAAEQAVSQRAVVEQYRRLLQAIATNGSDDLPAEAVSKAIEEIRAQAKDATRRFNEVYAEFSKVALRADSALYRVERPVHTSAIRSFGLRKLALIFLAVLVVSPVVLSVAFLSRYHLRRFVSSIRR